jgi:hypothetical protein
LGNVVKESIKKGLIGNLVGGVMMRMRMRLRLRMRYRFSFFFSSFFAGSNLDIGARSIMLTVKRHVSTRRVEVGLVVVVGFLLSVLGVLGGLLSDFLEGSGGSVHFCCSG